MTTRNAMRLFILATVGLVGLAAASAPAATIDWIGPSPSGSNGESGDATALWSIGTNWSNGSGPGASDIANFYNEYSVCDQDFNISGIYYAGATREIYRYTGTSPTITLGADGIDMGTTGTTVRFFTINTDLNQSVAAEWSTTAPSVITVAGDLSGAGRITKTGDGKLYLKGDNSSFSGGFDIVAGRLDVRYNGTDGTEQLGAGKLTLRDGVTFALDSGSGDLTAANALELDGVLSFQTIRDGRGMTFNGTTTLLSSVTLNLDGTSTGLSGLTLNGAIGDDGNGYGLVIGSAYNNGAPVVLGGANTFTGATMVNAGGHLTLANDAALDPLVALTVASGGLIEIAPDIQVEVSALTLGSTNVDPGTYSLSNPLPESGYVTFGDGNSSLTVAVPEPATAAFLAAGGLAMAGAGLRRRRRA